MKMIKKILVLIILTWASLVFAHKDFSRRTETTNFNPPGPSRSWMVLSNDKKLVYINWSKEYKFTIRNSDFPEDEFSSKNYPYSGLYLINGRQFLWDISNPFPEMIDVRPLNNQQFLIAFGPRETDKFEEMAFAIYRKGELIKKFQIKEFCNSNRYMLSELSKFNSHPSWFKNLEFDELNNKFTFEACNVLYSVDVSSGVISKKNLFPTFSAYKIELKIISLILLFLTPIMFFILFYFLLKKKGTLTQKIVVALFLLISFSAYPVFKAVEQSHIDPFEKALEDSYKFD